jgi:2-octaprenylphenol hydroxylase
MKMMDIVIVGAGIAGLALASALRKTGLRIAVLDRQAPEAVTELYSLRVSAINPGSERFLRYIDAWSYIARLQHFDGVSVWEKDSQACFDIHADDLDTLHLGHIIENNQLQHALLATLDSSTVEIRTDANIQQVSDSEQGVMLQCDDGTIYFTQWLVAADGAHSWLREHYRVPLAQWNYEQSALVATIHTERPHEQIARQIFTPHGPLAFLPLPASNQCSIVWTLPTITAQQHLALETQRFEHQLTAAFDACLGLCELSSERQLFPLTARYARQQITSRLVLLGDAAHTIHPLAGQGINLGLRDVQVFAEQIQHAVEHHGRMPEPAELRHYERSRKADAVQALASMELFKQLFAGTNPVKKWLRTTGLQLAQQAQPLMKPVLAQVLGIPPHSQH